MALASVLPAARLDLLKQNLRVLASPRKPQDMDDEALRALGLFDFVHLELPSHDVPLHRELLIDFISSFHNKRRQGNVRGNVISAHRDLFREALGIRCMKKSRPRYNVSSEALSSTARKFVQVYIQPVHMRTPGPGAGKVDEALSGIIEGNLACTVDWAGLIFKVAKKEIVDMVTEKRDIIWDCFYGTYWLRLIRVQKEDIFLHSIVVQQAPVGAIGASESMEGIVHAVIEPVMEKHGNRKLSELARVCAEASTSLHEGMSTGSIDLQREQDGENQSRNGDVLASIDGANVNNNHRPQPFEGLRTRLTGSPHASIEDETGTAASAKHSGASMSPISRTEHTILAFSHAVHARADAQSHEPLERIEEVNNYTTGTAAPRNSSAKQKIVDGSCEEIIAKKRQLSTSKVTTPVERITSSLEHTEVQAQMDLDMTLSIPPGGDVAILSKTSGTCLDGWDATKSITDISTIKQGVNETVQLYVENATKVFDFNSLPPAPKVLDQNPGALLQPPEESACPKVKDVFQVFMADLKNLQKLADHKDFNQNIFVEELSNKLFVWENFFAPYFTEGTKQMVKNLNDLKKELDSGAGQQPQHMMDVLSEKKKHAGQMLENGVLAREKISHSVREMEHMKLAGVKSNESINMRKNAKIKNIQEEEKQIQELKQQMQELKQQMLELNKHIQEREKKVSEEKRSLRLDEESSEVKNADFFAALTAGHQAIAESSSCLEKVIITGNAMLNEIDKRYQQLQGYQGLPVPLHQILSLLAQI